MPHHKQRNIGKVTNLIISSDDYDSASDQEAQITDLEVSSQLCVRCQVHVGLANF